MINFVHIFLLLPGILFIMAIYGFGDILNLELALFVCFHIKRNETEGQILFCLISENYTIRHDLVGYNIDLYSLKMSFLVNIPGGEKLHH